MGRPPGNGAPAFRFNPTEVAQMEAVLQEHQGQVPARELLMALAEKFSNSPERAGKATLQMKQVWNWFQNRRYALRAKSAKSLGKLNISSISREELAPTRNVPPAPQQIPVPSGYNVVRTSETQMEFEAKSARDGAWYDVQAFLSHRYLETGNPEVQVRFSGFGPEEEEWVNIRKHVRQRSLPCEAAECVAVLPGDLILCFQEGKEQALYFDAHILDAQRRRHDIRGCRCRFLVCYDHDQSEEIVPLRKVCRRPETDYRLQQRNAANEASSVSVSADPQKPVSIPLAHMNPAATAPSLVPVPASIPTSGPVPVLAPVPVPVSAPAQIPVPASTPCSVQVAIPAQKVVESNTSEGTLASGASTEANVISPEAGSTHMETAVSTGSINPVSVTPTSGPEKIDAGNPGQPELAGNVATVSTMAGSSSVNLSTEIINEKE